MNKTLDIILNILLPIATVFCFVGLILDSFGIFPMWMGIVCAVLLFATMVVLAIKQVVTYKAKKDTKSK